MLNFAPTEEQEEIRNLARIVAVEQLRPQGRGAERQGDISPSLMQMLLQTGLTTPFPEELNASSRNTYLLSVTSAMDLRSAAAWLLLSAAAGIRWQK